MRQIICGFDMSPTVAEKDVHASHWMKNDSEFFVWPLCRHCGLDAIHHGFLLTRPCGGYTEEDAEQQFILQRSIARDTLRRVSKEPTMFARIKAFLGRCFTSYAKAMEHHRP